ncbi:MAG TPA: cytochrome c-type biogenesis CcmF C-terminal domain-containing protein, partial [Burkholderiaceae bacterium]|nr:cytochrome c-type biogenesis CcmF C-terminal domain-containing protein [Burkholderiaceae bacterium]
LVHSLAVTEKRGSFKTWTVLLAIITFSMSLLGTFLVRSGVLTSVHAFATDPERGVFILGFLIFVIGSSLLLFAWRAPKVGLGGKFANVSRESMLLMNNVLLVVAMGAVFLGTMYPLFLDAIAGTKISVGPPYFDAVFAPLMAPLVFLMGVGPLSRWKEAKIPDLATRLRWAAAVAVVTAVLVPVVLGRWSWIVSGGLLLAFWIVASAVVNVREHIRNVRGSLLTRLASQPRAFWGMNLAHLGVAIFIIGVTLVKGYETERDVRMAVGDVVSVGGFTFKFEGVQEVQGPNYVAARGTFDVSKNGRFIEKLYPEKRSYLSNRAMPMTEAAIDSSIIGDIYVSLGEPVGGDAWTVRAYYKPFVTWIWWGCVAMALGGLVALSDRRYRFARRREASAAKAAVTA